MEQSMTSLGANTNTFAPCFNRCFREDADGKAGIYGGREIRVQREDVSGRL